MNRKELLKVPRRNWLDEITAKGVWVIPSRRKHDSGWACMDFVAETDDGLVRFGGGCDDVAFKGSHFRMDCDYPSAIIHIWNNHPFVISADLSSIDFEERSE